jgi:hypothetical protein
MPPPTPPSVNEGRMTSGKPSVFAELDASAERARAALRHVEADLAHRVLEQLPILGDLDRLIDAPISSTLYLSRVPASPDPREVQRVWPPTVGSSASGARAR